jgi:hypothetical protein
VQDCLIRLVPVFSKSAGSVTNRNRSLISSSNGTGIIQNLTWRRIRENSS